MNCETLRKNIIIPSAFINYGLGLDVDVESIPEIRLSQQIREKKIRFHRKNGAYNLSILSASGFGIDLIFEYIANASFPSHGWTNDAYLICFQFTLCAYNVGACHKKYWLDHGLRAFYNVRLSSRQTSIQNALIINVIESFTIKIITVSFV